MICKNCRTIQEAKDYYYCTQDNHCLSRLCLVCWSQILNKENMQCYCHLFDKPVVTYPLEHLSMSNEHITFHNVVMTKMNKKTKQIDPKIIKMLMESIV